MNSNREMNKVLVLFFLLCFLKAKNLKDVKDFLRMSIESYSKEKEDVSNYKLIYSFGYSKDGVRAKVFESQERVVVAIKGTTLYFLGIGLGSTGHKDREMDNLMFGVCEEDCAYLKKIKIDEIGYLKDLENLVRTVLLVFKGKGVVFTGHSLGGALSSLMSLRFRLPAIAFSSPGEKYVATLLNFPLAKSLVTHFGICEDSLFVGSCGSLCTLGGYSITTACHLGRSYCLGLGDGSSNTNDSLRHHRAETLLEQLLKEAPSLYQVECVGY